MKTRIVILFIAAVVVSCSTSKTFPISDLAPAAEITVKQKTDNNDNNEVIVKAKYLASPERVSRNANTYVVWLVSEENGIKNIGALYNKNGENSELKTITPFVGTEIFITAEKEAEISQPSGKEITRVNL